MGFEDVNSGEGFTKFGKGANLLIKADSIDHSQGSYQGDEYQQLDLVFVAVPENGGEQGRAPAWPTSKITIGESDEHTSKLAQLLTTAGVLEDVLRDLGADDDLVTAIEDGDKRYEAQDDGENQELMQAVAKHLGGVVLRAGSKWNGDEEYSKVTDFYERSEQDPFSGDPADSTESSDSADEAAESADEEAALA